MKKNPDGWVPLTTRELTPREKRELSIRYGDAIGNETRKLVCQLPEDGQKVLITTAWGDVVIDIFHADPDGVFFEDHEDMDEVIAWRPLIEPYKEDNAPTVVNEKLTTERPQGEWIYNQYCGNPNIGNWHCSECRHIIYGGYSQKPYYNFCPNCGARMKGGQADE